MPAPSPPPLEQADSFADATFSDLSLDAADLSGKDLIRCTFQRCKFSASRWARARLEDCVFDACDLTRMAPQELALRGVTFKDSKLMGVDWSHLGPLPDARFEGCDLRYASLVKLRLRATRFVGCTAREANFVETDLSEADFTGTDLTGASFQGCTLSKTNFAAATGVLFDPQRNKVAGARLSLEAAVVLVQSFGIQVQDFDGPERPKER